MQKVKTKTAPLWKVPHGVCNKGKNDVNNPLLVRKMCVKRLCCLRQKTTSTTNKKSKLNSAVQKRRSSTPPFLILFYKPFCRANICKTDVFDFFINQRFERNFLPFVANQRFRNWRFRRFSCVWQRNFQDKHFFARGIVFRNLQSCMFAMQFLRESCFFAVKIVLYCLYGTGKFANKT